MNRGSSSLWTIRGQIKLKAKLTTPKKQVKSVSVTQLTKSRYLPFHQKEKKKRNASLSLVSVVGAHLTGVSSASGFNKSSVVHACQPLDGSDQY